MSIKEIFPGWQNFNSSRQVKDIIRCFVALGVDVLLRNDALGFALDNNIQGLISS